MWLPIIALVGRPNVGKSTIFNRLTKTQKALVADFPGLTRDRQYGEASFGEKKFMVVDTGGIGVEDIHIDRLMSSQSMLAMQEATRLFFVVDGRSGLTATDELIAKRLRKFGKPIDLVVNKMDGLTKESMISDMQSLGFSSIYFVSAAHNQGLSALLQGATASFLMEEEKKVENEAAIKIAFIGRPNVGKSTLVNRILGEERVVVYDMPGTTRDSIEVPFEREGQDYILIDTAGVRRRGRVNEAIEKFSIIKTLQSIQSAHVCLLLIDAQEGLTDQDLHLLGAIIEAGKALVILINKWDGLENEHKEQIRAALDRRLSFVRFAKIKTISALHGTGVGLLFKDILEAYGSAMQSLSTPYLTRLLQVLVAKHPPPLVNGRRIKMRYAHAGGSNPPLIVIHGNQLAALPESYKRYLKNAFIEELSLIGTPLALEFKGGENPYKDKKNQLTNRQLFKRKRLMKRVKK